MNTIKSFGKVYYRNENCIDLKINKLNFNEGNNIMLISNNKFPTLRNLLKTVKPVDKIDFILPQNILPNPKYDNMKKYKMIIFDLQDAGFCDTNNPEVIKKYLNDGGNIIVTHDHWTYNKKGCAHLFGAKIVNQNYVHVKKAKIINNLHPVFTSFYQLDYGNQKIIDIARTHKTNTIYENVEEYKKDILMELEDGKQGEYLIIKDIGKGKLIFWNAGDSYNDSITDSLTDYEQKLFVNFIYYIFS